MTEYRAHHEHASCPLCEPGPLAGFCRHWKVERKVGAWHIMADGPDLMQRIPRQAHFVTILAYRPSSKGGPAHYRGPLYWEGDHTKGKHLDTWTILFAPGDGEVMGWFHCSHAHCHGRGLRDILAVFTEDELAHARQAAGLVRPEGLHVRQVSAASWCGIPTMPAAGMLRCCYRL
jgi:hypothetical protein